MLRRGNIVFPTMRAGTDVTVLLTFPFSIEEYSFKSDVFDTTVTPKIKVGSWDIEKIESVPPGAATQVSMKLSRAYTTSFTPKTYQSDILLISDGTAQSYFDMTIPVIEGLTQYV